MTVMSQTFLAAAIQMNAGENKRANLATAERLVTDAANKGATLIALPEMFNLWGRFENMVAQAEPIPGPTSTAASEWARRLKITLVAGSIAEKVVNPQTFNNASDQATAYNTSLVFGPDGQLLASYRKQHLFDVNFTGQAPIRESEWIMPGNANVVTPTPLGNLGQAICYDLRFPELFRRMADRNVEVIVIPSAFLQATGAAHWEVLLRARAIENQAFVIAPNQCGCTENTSPTFGHSQIIDPWGTVLASATEENETVVVAEIDLLKLKQIREQLPALRHRRL